MSIAKNNVQEYNEMMGLSVEEFLIRLKLYVDEIETIQKQNNAIKLKSQRNGR